MAAPKLHKDTIILQIPTWAARLYIGAAALLIPWTIYLAWSLPSQHISTHWDVSWAGVDIALILSFLLTGIFALVRSMWVVIAASSTGSFLLVDAWFDIMSEHGGKLFHEALASAVVLEVPLALLSYYLAAHALKRVKKRAHKKR